MTRIILAYRDNTLFRRYIPAVLDALTANGNTVETLVIPASVSADDALKQAREFLSQQQESGLYVSDKTCSCEYGWGIASENCERLEMPRQRAILDELFASLVNDQLKVSTFEEGIKKVLEMYSVDRKIDKVLMVEGNIGDHIQGDASSDAQFLRAAASQMMTDARVSWNRFFVDMFERHINNAIPGIEVIRYPTYKSAVPHCEELTTSLMVTDRHSEGFPGYREPLPSCWDRIVVLPLADAVANLVKAEKLEATFDPDQICEKILNPSRR